MNSAADGYYPSEAAQRWTDALDKKIAAMPGMLADMGDVSAGQYLERVLEQPGAFEKLGHAAKKFDLARRPSRGTVRQRDMSELCSAAADIEKAIVALQARQAEVLGALVRAETIPTIANRDRLAKNFRAAHDAVYALRQGLREIEVEVLTKFGPDVGGPSLTAPEEPPVEHLGIALADLWLACGLDLKNKDREDFLAVLRLFNEQLTGGEEIRSENRVVSRIRKHFGLGRNPIKKSTG